MSEVPKYKALPLVGHRHFAPNACFWRRFSYYEYYLKNLDYDFCAVELGKRESVEGLAIGQLLIFQNADRDGLAQLQ